MANVVLSLSPLPLPPSLTLNPTATLRNLPPTSSPTSHNRYVIDVFDVEDLRHQAVFLPNLAMDEVVRFNFKRLSLQEDEKQNNSSTCTHPPRNKGNQESSDEGPNNEGKNRDDGNQGKNGAEKNDDIELEEREVLRAVFEMMDTDGNGKLSKREVLSSICARPDIQKYLRSMEGKPAPHTLSSKAKKDHVPPPPSSSALPRNL